MVDIFCSNDDQCFYTYPDGDIATPKQIKDYYENKGGIKNGFMD